MSRKIVWHHLARVALFSLLLVTLAGGLTAPVSAQEPNNSGLRVFAKYPTAERKSGEVFSYELEVSWNGSGTRTFNLVVDNIPQNWDAELTGGYPARKVFSVVMQPTTSPVGEFFTLTLSPKAGVLPEPGEYSIDFVVTSGDIRESVKLTARVVAKYDFSFYPTEGRLSTEVIAGRENHFALRFVNSGSAPITRVRFLSENPPGWTVRFIPEEVDKVDPGYTLPLDIDLIIKPPSKTVPGDYLVNVRAAGQEVPTKSQDIRVTVTTSTAWGWVGVIIVLLVIAGLMFMFRQLGRR